MFALRFCGSIVFWGSFFPPLMSNNKNNNKYRNKAIYSLEKLFRCRVKQNRLPLCVHLCGLGFFFIISFNFIFFSWRTKKENAIKWSGWFSSWKGKEKNTNYHHHHHHTEFLLPLLRSWYTHIITYKSFKIRVGSTIKILFIVQRVIPEDITRRSFCLQWMGSHYMDLQ